MKATGTATSASVDSATSSPTVSAHSTSASITCTMVRAPTAIPCRGADPGARRCLRCSTTRATSSVQNTTAAIQLQRGASTATRANAPAAASVQSVCTRRSRASTTTRSIGLVGRFASRIHHR